MVAIHVRHTGREWVATVEDPDLDLNGLGDDEITTTGELMQQYDLDDMVEADVAELAEGLEDSPGF